jgi:cysteine desulfurase/selenocysteine lyase
MDIAKIRNDFPILKRKVNGNNFIYLDNAATSQKPNLVIDSISDYYKNYNSNIHRGVHTVSQEATDAYENARIKIQKHFNVKNSYEIILTSGTTHSINLVANGFLEKLNEKDEIIISGLEHHSNIVPWQMMAEKNGAKIKIIPINENGELDMKIYDSILSNKTKLVFVNHVSNALGTVNPIKKIIDKAHKLGAAVLVDGAQASAHFKTDLQKLNVDFYTTSAHKLCGPTGIGMLFGKEKWLKKMPPYQGGGEMISDVTLKKLPMQICLISLKLEPQMFAELLLLEWR